jgi:hypothetical protein
MVALDFCTDCAKPSLGRIVHRNISLFRSMSSWRLVRLCVTIVCPCGERIASGATEMHGARAFPDSVTDCRFAECPVLFTDVDTAGSRRTRGTAVGRSTRDADAPRGRHARGCRGLVRRPWVDHHRRARCDVQPSRHALSSGRRLGPFECRCESGNSREAVVRPSEGKVKVFREWLGELGTPRTHAGRQDLCGFVPIPLRSLNTACSSL